MFIFYALCLYTVARRLHPTKQPIRIPTWGKTDNYKTRTVLWGTKCYVGAEKQIFPLVLDRVYRTGLCNSSPHIIWPTPHSSFFLYVQALSLMTLVSGETTDSAIGFDWWWGTCSFGLLPHQLVRVRTAACHSVMRRWHLQQDWKKHHDSSYFCHSLLITQRFIFLPFFFALYCFVYHPLLSSSLNQTSVFKGPLNAHQALIRCHWCEM